MVPVDEFNPKEQRGNTAVVSTKDNEVSSRTRNYEVNKTKEVFRKSQGKIEHLSASVVINYKQTTQEQNGEQVIVNEPYSQEKIQEFKEVDSSALGIQPERGDELTIKQVQFWDPTQGPPGNGMARPMPWSNIIRWALILATFAAIVGL